MAGRGGGGWGSSPTRLVAPTVLEEDGGGGAVPPPATRMPARCDRHYRPHPLALSVAGGAQAHVAALAAGAVAGSPAPFLVCPSAPVASKSSSLLHAQAHEEDWCARESGAVSSSVGWAPWYGIVRTGWVWHL